MIAPRLCKVRTPGHGGARRQHVCDKELILNVPIIYRSFVGLFYSIVMKLPSEALYSLAIFLLFAHRGLSVKPCLDLERLRYDEPDCPTPQMTHAYCHNTSSSPCINARTLATSEKDVCDLVTQSFLAEFEVFDVVLLPASSCQADIQKGDFTYDDAERVLPNNEELIYVRIDGSKLLSILKHGLSLPLSETRPKVAGVRFKTRELLHGNMHVFNVETLGDGCVWKELDNKKFYNILTVESLVEGQYHGYQLLPPGSKIDNSGRASRMDRFLRDMFWQFTNNVCTVKDPFRRPVRATRPIQLERDETVIIRHPSQRNITSVI